MNWFRETGFGRKPIVVIEDHTFHLGEIVDALARGPWLAQTTLVCLDRQGPDTTAVVRQWLEDHAHVQVAARLPMHHWKQLPAVDRVRCLPLSDEVFNNRNFFCKTVASLVRPAGLLVQDIQLETLTFIAEEDWWETIFLATSVRGMLASAPPACRFMSNKSGFGISFGKELMEAGFDPRHVMDKNRLTATIEPLIQDYLTANFPLRLEYAYGEEEPQLVFVSAADQPVLENALHLLIWETAAGLSLGGKLVKGKGADAAGPRLKGQEAITWRELVEDRLSLGAGLAVDQVGARIAAEGALKAERVNTAARHLHTLRGRLNQTEVILTDQGSYGLDPALSVGRVRAAEP